MTQEQISRGIDLFDKIKDLGLIIDILGHADDVCLRGTVKGHFIGAMVPFDLYRPLRESAAFLKSKYKKELSEL